MGYPDDELNAKHVNRESNGTYAGFLDSLLCRFKSQQSIVFPNVNKRVHFTDNDLPRACQLAVKLGRRVDARIIVCNSSLVGLDVLRMNLVFYLVGSHQRGLTLPAGLTPTHSGIRERISEAAE